MASTWAGGRVPSSGASRSRRSISLTTRSARWVSSMGSVRSWAGHWAGSWAPPGGQREHPPRHEQLDRFRDELRLRGDWEEELGDQAGREGGVIRLATEYHRPPGPGHLGDEIRL